MNDTFYNIIPRDQVREIVSDVIERTQLTTLTADERLLWLRLKGEKPKYTPKYKYEITDNTTKI